MVNDSVSEFTSAYRVEGLSIDGTDDVWEEKDIVVVIPAYNEELTIGTVVLGAKKYATEVIVVDDGSTDYTSEIATLAGAKVIRLEENHGKAFAVKMGFAEIDPERTSAAIMMDADGQHCSRDIITVLGPIVRGEADLVIGSRLIENGHDIPLYRRIGQQLLNHATNVGSQKKVSDSQSGFRALSPAGIRNMDFESDGYGLESSMIFHFASRGLRMVEVPIGVKYDVPHKHKKNAVSMGFGLMNLLISQISLKRPLMYIGVPGFILTMAGLLLGLAALSGQYLWGWSWMFESILAGFMATFGAIVCISGLTLNSIAHLVNIQSRAAPLVDRRGTETKDPMARPAKGRAR